MALRSVFAEFPQVFQISKIRNSKKGGDPLRCRDRLSKQAIYTLTLL